MLYYYYCKFQFTLKTSTVKTDVSVQHECVIMMSSGKALIGVNWHINMDQIKSFWYDLIQHII